MVDLLRMKISLCLMILLSGLVWVGPSIAAESGKARVVVVPISGEVEPSMAAFVKRAVKEDGSNTLYVFELDTFGGRVDSALQIVETLTELPPDKSVALVKTKAISAGALIALACNRLYMKSGTTIGDCAPIIYGEDGPKMMGEKFQSPLRAKFRSLAKRNGYPEALAESMVSADMVVYEVVFPDRKIYLDQQAYDDLDAREKKRMISKRTVVEKGELLTMDDVEAKAMGFSGATVASLEELLAQQGISDYELVRVETSWSEDMGRFIGMISPILLIIGLGGIYMELKAPGFGAPGILGITCLALVFLNQYLIGLAEFTELLLIMLGIAFLGIELFVTPGFGVMGVAGLVAIAAGMILSFQDFVVPDPNLPWQGEIFTANLTRIMSAYLGAFILSMLFLKYVFPRLGRVVDGPYLATTLRESKAHSDEAARVRKGDVGVVVNALRPSGKAEFGGETVDVIAEGEFMDPGSRVEVTEVRGNRVIVIRSDS